MNTITQVSVVGSYEYDNIGSVGRLMKMTTYVPVTGS
jgi:hypothetical protein